MQLGLSGKQPSGAAWVTDMGLCRGIRDRDSNDVTEPSLFKSRTICKIVSLSEPGF